MLSQSAANPADPFVRLRFPESLKPVFFIHIAASCRISGLSLYGYAMRYQNRLYCKGVSAYSQFHLDENRLKCD
ncbi:hypothetical membrane protein [Syntrophus aciditrophicus SB]|uniref:Hypothetical membrane protein n=1 Tax=Syntrophus aciditrophicus (strain SB) TaxID=56780 RepID=Q2LWZ0_SYNAS|nr:hypothetical membrane protein [Syntrophus aciditrophicus SB]